MSVEGRPVALASIGLLSLLGFAAVGGALRGLRERQTATPPATTALVPTSNPTLARGKLVFQIHCARCHGAEGHGDGPDSATLRPQPRDLSSSEWRTGATHVAVRRAVTEGLPNTMMPPLGASLSTRELDAVVDFVLNLGPAPITPDLTPLLERAGFTPDRSGRPAPSFEAVDASGGATVSTRGLRGSVVLLVFWGTTCAPCLKEMPSLETLAERYRGKGLVVVPLCGDETEAGVVDRVAHDRAPGLPVYVDPSGLAKLSFDVQALPFAALIATDGRLLGTARGASSWSSPALDSLLMTLLGPEAIRSSDEPRPR